MTRDGQTLVFVEVRSTSHEDGASAEHSVDAAKQARLTRLASAFMHQFRVQEVNARFDVVILSWPSQVTEPTIKHFENAFPALGRSSMYS